MTRKRTAIACPREPIGLRLDEAAAFVGCSPTLFRKAVSEGTMPCPHELRGAMIWSADELALAFARLPRKLLDLKPGVAPPHDDPVSEDPWDTAPRA